MSEEKKKGNVFSRGDTDEEKKARYSAGAFISIMAMIVGGLFMVAWMPTVSRLLGSSGMSTVGAFTGLLMSLLTLSAIGVNNAITTFVSHNYEIAPDEANRYVAGGIQLFIYISAAVLLITGISAAVVAFRSGIGSGNFVLTVLTGVTIVVTLIFWFVNAILSGYNRMDLTAVANTLNPIGMLFGSVGLVLLARAAFGKGSEFEVVGGCAGWLVGAMFASAGAILVYRAQAFYIPIGVCFKENAGKEVYKTMITFGGVAVVAAIGHSFLTNIPPTIVTYAANLGWIGTGVSDGLRLSGYFSVAYLFSQVMVLIMGFTQPLLPSISEAHAQGKTELVQHYATVAMRGGISLVLLAVTIYAAAAGQLIQVMNGPKFPADQIGPVTLTYTFGQGLNMLFFVVINIFFAIKKPAFAAFAVLVSLAVETTALFGLSYFTHDISTIVFGLVAGGVTSMSLGIFGIYKVAKLKIPVLTYLPGFAATAITIPVLLKFFPKDVHVKSMLISTIGGILMWGLIFVVSGGLKSPKPPAEKATIQSA